MVSDDNPDEKVEIHEVLLWLFLLVVAALAGGIIGWTLREALEKSESHYQQQDKRGSNGDVTICPPCPEQPVVRQREKNSL